MKSLTRSIGFLDSKSKNILSAYEGIHISKQNYEFEFISDTWKLSGDHTIKFNALPDMYPDFEIGFRAALARAAEEYSSSYIYSVFYEMKKYLLVTGEKRLTLKGVSAYRSQFDREREFQLAGVRAFWMNWYDCGLPGIQKESVDFLEELTFRSPKVGQAVLKHCPYTGPLTVVEQTALLEWAANAFATKIIDLPEYTFFISLMFTGRRPVQIRGLRVSDLSVVIKLNQKIYKLRIPRAKQIGVGFRDEFREIEIIEDLYLLLKSLIAETIYKLEEEFHDQVPKKLINNLPVFIQWKRLFKCVSLREVEKLLKDKPDYLHLRMFTAADYIRKFKVKCEAKSERTGDYIFLNSRRLRYTKATNLSRKGISGFVLAEALDHSSIDSIGIYTENTVENAKMIDKIMSDSLAPLAQAFAGTLIDSERDAVRADDPHSRVKNDRSKTVGNCRSYGFCASGIRACYTCVQFQPWRDAPHEAVLEDLLVEREEKVEAGVSENVIKATDRLLLAVTEVISLCKQAKAEAMQ